VRVIYLDPWIEGNAACPLGLDEAPGAGILRVAHGRDDHLGNSFEIVRWT